MALNDFYTVKNCLEAMAKEGVAAASAQDAMDDVNDLSRVLRKVLGQYGKHTTMTVLAGMTAHNMASLSDPEFFGDAVDVVMMKLRRMANDDHR